MLSGKHQYFFTCESFCFCSLIDTPLLLRSFPLLSFFLSHSPFGLIYLFILFLLTCTCSLSTHLGELTTAGFLLRTFSCFIYCL